MTIIKEPWIDLRNIFFFIANVLSIIGFSLNLFLLYLIVYKTSKKMTDYRIILLHNWCADIVFNIASDLVKCHTEIKTGTFYIIESDWLKPLPYLLNMILIHFWVFSLFYCVTTIPAQFVYRYLFIIFEKKLSIMEYMAMLVITILGPLIIIGLWIYAELSEIEFYENKMALLAADPYYFRGIPYFISARIQFWPLRFCCGAGLLLVIISYAITIYTFWAVWKKLKNAYYFLSPATRQMHNQLTKTMILQAIVPLIFILFPIGIVLIAVFSLVNIPGFGIVCNLICCWIPVVNPLVTILSVKSYRTTVSNCFRKSFVMPSLNMLDNIY